MSNWRDYIGRRVLIRKFWSLQLEETTIKEVSSNGRIKFQWLTGYCGWEEPNTYVLEEVLENV